MNGSWKLLRLTILAMALAVCAGCNGISAGRSFSPLDFILPGYGLPGLLKNKPAPPVDSTPLHEAVPILAQAD